MSDDPVLSALSRLEAGLTGLQASQADLQAGQADLRAGQTAIENRLATLERNQTTLRVDMMDRMDRLEDKVTAIREDIGVNMGAIQHDREALESTRGDMHGLRQRVDLMWRQIKRLEQQVRDITGEP